MATIDKELFKRIRKIEIFTNKLVEDLLGGAYKSAFRGNGMEFEEVRPYYPGDDVRTIDWNVTARMRTPYIKRFQEERELTVMLLVDVSASGRFGTGSLEKRELIAEIGAALAFSAIKNQDKVGLILFSDQIELYLPPKKGTRHVLRVIRELLAFSPQGKGTDLAKALDFLGNVRGRMAVGFLLSDFQCPLNFTKEFAINARRHDMVLMQVNDPREESFPLLPLISFSNLETNETHLVDMSLSANREAFTNSFKERKEALRTLAGKGGAGWVEFTTDKSYVEVLRKYFSLRKEHQR